jgi:uncharacterized Zn finger protein (UPF0148 family)
MNPKSVTLTCPEDGRFLAEVSAFGRVVCPNCGSEVTYRNRDERKRPLTTMPNGSTLEIKT